MGILVDWIELYCYPIQDSKTEKVTSAGISNENISRVFDPYFTTKELGKGSGMGLSVVHGIIKNHNGTIEVSSQPDSGTVFTMFFPVMDQTPEIIKKEINEFSHGTETILFVDDEESIVKMNEKMLSRIGYTEFLNRSFLGRSFYKVVKKRLFWP
jgi:two-component system, cell cycle sensor histidine kinase and response regulator CckA